MREVNRSASRQTVANIGWNYASGLLGVGGLVLLYPLAVHAAGAELYGLWIVCFGLVQLLILADLGIATGIVRSIAGARAADHAKADVTRAVSLGLTLFGALALGLGVIFAIALPTYLGILRLEPDESKQLPSLVVIAVFALVLGVLGRGANAVLWGDNRYDIERKWAMGGLLARATAIGICAATQSGILAVALTEAISVVLPGLACLVVAIRWHAPRIVNTTVLRNEGLPLLRFSSKVFVGAFAAVLAVQVPFFIAAPALTLVQITALGAWLRLYQGTRLLFSWLANPFLTVAATASITPTVQNRHAQSRLFVASALIALAVSGPLIAIPKQLVTAWLGSDFSFASTSFMFIAVAAAGMVLAIPSSVLATAHGRPGPVSAMNVVWLASTIVAVLIVRSHHSLTTICASIAIPLVVLSPIYFYQSHKVTGIGLTAADATALVAGVVVVGLATLVIYLVSRNATGRGQVILGIGAYVVTAGLGGTLMFRQRLLTRWRLSGARA